MEWFKVIYGEVAFVVFASIDEHDDDKGDTWKQNNDEWDQEKPIHKGSIVSEENQVGETSGEEDADDGQEIRNHWQIDQKFHKSDWRRRRQISADHRDQSYIANHEVATTA